jgi:hypothetical protein
MEILKNLIPGLLAEEIDRTGMIAAAGESKVPALSIPRADRIPEN